MPKLRPKQNQCLELLRRSSSSTLSSSTFRPLPASVTILGAGLTSLSLAHRLTTLSPQTSITIIDQASEVGGWASSRTVKIPKFAVRGKGKEVAGAGEEKFWEITIEKGPRSIRGKGGKAAFVKLVEELNLVDEIVYVPPTHAAAKNRYLLPDQAAPGGVSGPALLKLPSSPLSALFTLFNPSLWFFLPSVLTEPFRPRIPLSKLGSDTSVDTLVRSRFGNRVADLLMSSMIHGIYAADSRNLSVRTAFPFLWDAVYSPTRSRYGSLVLSLIFGLKGENRPFEVMSVRKEEKEWEQLGDFGAQVKSWSIWSLRAGGIGRVSNTAFKELERLGVRFRLGEKIESLEPIEGGVKIKTNKGEDVSPLVISTIPSSHLSQSISPANILPHLVANPSATVYVNTIVFTKSDSETAEGPPNPPGFGYLIPRRKTVLDNPLGVLGVIFDSDSLPTVDPSSEGLRKYTVMMGGPNDMSFLADKSAPFEEQTISSTKPSITDAASPSAQLAIKHLKKIFPSLWFKEPVHVSSFTHKNCIPTYLPGHGDRMKELDEAILNSNWKGKLVLGGASFSGISVGDCVANGRRLAEELVGKGEGDESVTGLEKFRDWV